MKKWIHILWVMSLTFGLGKSIIYSADYGLDMIMASDSFVRIETQWPIAKLAPHRQVRGYGGVYLIEEDEENVQPIIGVAVGYYDRLFSTEAIWLEWEFGIGAGVGGYSNSLGDGFFLKTGVSLLMQWLLPVQYGVTYQYHMGMLTANNNEPLSAAAGAAGIIFRLPVKKEFFFPDITPFMEKDSYRELSE